MKKRNHSVVSSGISFGGVLLLAGLLKIANTVRLLVLILFGISFYSVAATADADEINNMIFLWPKDANITPSEIKATDLLNRRNNIDTPYLQYYPAPDTNQPTPAFILCPGGGYGALGVGKMTPIAKWLNENGISAFVLKYRTPNKREEAFQDIQRAIRIVRSRSSEWKIDPGRIGVMGMSAGAHLAARASTGFELKTYQEVDKIDGISCKPDFTVLLSSAYLNKGESVNPDFTVSSKINPILMISTKDDELFFPGNPIFAQALKDAGVSVRVHFFEIGGHGFVLRPKQHPLSTWPDLCLQWLKDIGVLKEKAKTNG